MLGCLMPDASHVINIYCNKKHTHANYRDCMLYVCVYVLRCDFVN